VTFYRSNGDELSLLFQKEGTLSTAYLKWGDQRRDVSSLLPGICESNVHDYLRPFGFQQVPLGSHVYPLLAHLFLHGLTTTQIEEKDTHLKAAVIYEKDRSSPICPAIFVGLFSHEGQLLKVLKKNVEFDESILI